MERDKKRKKKSPEENDGVVEAATTKKKKKKKKTRKAEREEAAEVEEPTTEEVEEFCAILRRMNVALEYLKGAQKRLTERRTAAESNGGGVGENKELNLNEVPADSTN